MSGLSRAYPLYRMTWQLLDLVFPPRCAGCDRPGERWCGECRAEIKALGANVCPVCGVPRSGMGVCQVCTAHPPQFTALRSWAAFEGSVRKVLHRLKYRRDVALGQTLAEAMSPALQALDWKVDLVVPVPLGKKRQTERGYNQAALIACPLSLALGLQYAPSALVRWRESHSQVGLSREQRRENVSGVFRAGRGASGRTVLLVDDVATTGSTLSSAAGALLEGGAGQVYAFTAARAASTKAA